MAETTTHTIAAHGASRLPNVEVDSYNVELKDDEGFIGDRASKGAFREIIENWRKPLRKGGVDPFGDTPSDKISKKELDQLFAKGDPEAAGVVQGAIEDFSQALAFVIQRFLKTKAWKDTERLVIGGGFRASRVGELAIGRTAVILKAEQAGVDLVPIRNDPDEAGLIGATQLAPSWMFEAHDAILAVDIGGTNIRAGVVSTEPQEGEGPVQGRRLEIRAVASRRREGEPRGRGRAARRHAEPADCARRQGRNAPRSLHWHRLSGQDRGGRVDRSRRAEPARQLGEQQVQPAGAPARGDPQRSAITRPRSSCTTTPWCRA